MKIIIQISLEAWETSRTTTATTTTIHMPWMKRSGLAGNRELNQPNAYYFICVKANMYNSKQILNTKTALRKNISCFSHLFGMLPLISSSHQYSIHDNHIADTSIITLILTRYVSHMDQQQEKKWKMLQENTRTQSKE